jgi:hypothetical protein
VARKPPRAPNKTAGFAIIFANFGSDRLAKQAPAIADVKMMANPAVLFGALGGFLATYCSLVFCDVDKKVPTNYILLVIFTFC